MRLKRKLALLTENTCLGDIVYDSKRRILLMSAASLAINAAYAIYNGVLGFIYGSLWFLTLSAYYIILSVMRFAAVSCGRKETETEEFVMRFTGVMLVVLSLVLAGSVYYSVRFEVARANGTIVMITIATYTFYKVIAAFVRAAKTAKQRIYLFTALRSIACADAAASVLSLQRSMLVSFKGMSGAEIKLMNTVTGIGVCLFVFVSGAVSALGIIGGRRNGKIKNSKGE